MEFRRLTVGVLLAGAISAGGLAVASPAWAGTAGREAVSTCRLSADAPIASRSSLEGTGHRKGCSDTVTYFWVRVYKNITMWPDSEMAVHGKTYVQNGEGTAKGKCAERTEYYTHTSTATGVSGDSVESGRALLC